MNFSLESAIKNTREISFDELDNCMSVDCLDIKKVNMFDFYSFDKILREKKRKMFKTEEDYQSYKREILYTTKAGTCDLPIICVHSEKMWNIIDGKIRLLAYKVLGINPVVEFRKW